MHNKKPFHTVHGVLKARILKWLAIPFSSGPHSVRPLHHDPPVLGYRTGHGLVSELDKAVVRVLRLASCLWLWFPSVCPLMPSLRACCLTWVPLTLDVGSLLTAAPAKRSCCSWPWTWGSSYGFFLWIQVKCLQSPIFNALNHNTLFSQENHFYAPMDNLSF